MKRWLLMLVVWLWSGLAWAVPYTLKIDGTPFTVDGQVQDGQLFVSLMPLLQALTSKGVRPSGFDYTAKTIQLTKGDGSKSVSASFQLINQQPYVAVVQATAGLGFQASVSGTTVTISTQAAKPPAETPPIQAAPSSLYPKGFTAKEFESVASALVSEMSTSSSDVLKGVLNVGGLPVYGTPTRPADGDMLEVYQALHHPFSTVLELYTLKVGYQYRLFTPIDTYLAGLSERGVGGKLTLTAQNLPGKLNALFAGQPSRSQAAVALVGAIGRERVKRGISNSFKRDPFWGDDALDPVQLRLLSAVLENGPGPEKALKKQGQKPRSASNYQFALYRQGPDIMNDLIPGPIKDLYNKIAEKAVKEIVKETYPDGAEWLDNQVQDALGIPIVLPISSDLLEGVLKGDEAGIKKTWAGLLSQAATETAKEGARAIFCGSIVLYGYQSKIQADPQQINHRTDGDDAGKSLSKMTVTLTYAGDYRDHVFKTAVRWASRLALKKPLTTVGDMLDRLGCKLPEGNPVEGKGVEWEVTGDVQDHINGGKPDFADPATNAGGVAKAQFRAIDEKTPKPFRTTQQSATGNVFVRFKNLLPEKWWLVQAAAQFGQGTGDDTSDTGKAGSSSQRLLVKYYQPPDLTLTMHSTMTGHSEDVEFTLQLDSDITLKPKWSGDPNDPRSKFLGYEGTGTLRYGQHTMSGKCGAKIMSVKDGQLEVRVVAQDFNKPNLTVILNPGFSVNSKYPTEAIVASNCPSIPGNVGLWFGSWLAVYSNESNKIIKSLPNDPFGGAFITASTTGSTTLLDKTISGSATGLLNAQVTDTTSVQVKVKK